MFTLRDSRGHSRSLFQPVIVDSMGSNALALLLRRKWSHDGARLHATPVSSLQPALDGLRGPLCRCCGLRNRPESETAQRASPERGSGTWVKSSVAPSAATCASASREKTGTDSATSEGCPHRQLTHPPGRLRESGAGFRVGDVRPGARGRARKVLRCAWEPESGATRTLQRSPGAVAAGTQANEAGEMPPPEPIDAQQHYAACEGDMSREGFAECLGIGRPAA